jgi:23S rRNA G2445 N2-methylase RlmL
VSARDSFFVTCAPGIEPLLHAEIRALRLAKAERQVGGVYFEGDAVDAMRANLWLRTAVRVLQRVARFEAADADRLYAGVQSVDWRRFLRADGSLVVDARSRESALDHTLFVAQRVKDAVVDQFRAREGRRPDVSAEEPDLAIHVHLYRDRCTLLVDTSGESLHKRGWRRFQGRAPLAETLAAALVLQSGWDRRAPLLDPFCGSGTLLIEAAALARNVAPGSFGREFGFMRWPAEWSSAWERLLAEARAGVKPAGKLVLQGSDSDAAAIAGALANLESARMGGSVEFTQRDALQLDPRRGWNAWIVTNPPYGERIGRERDLEALYRGFGALLRERRGGYHVALLSGNPKLARALGLQPTRSTACTNGALECEMLEFEP